MGNMDLKSLINSTISASELNRNAAKVLGDVVDKKEKFIIIKNNKPSAVIMSIEEYLEMLEKLEKFEKMK